MKILRRYKENIIRFREITPDGFGHQGLFFCLYMHIIKAEKEGDRHGHRR